MGFFYKEEEWVEDNPVEKEDEYVEIFDKSKGHPISCLLYTSFSGSLDNVWSTIKFGSMSSCPKGI